MVVSGDTSSWVKISCRKFIVGTSLLCGVCLHQLMEMLTHWRQIILPTPFPLTNREIRISPLYFFFEVHTHSRHHFKIAHHGPSDFSGDRLSLLAQGFHCDQQLRFQVWIVNVH